MIRPRSDSGRQRNRLNQPVAVSLAALVAGLTICGCGGDEEDEPDAGAQDTTATATDTAAAPDTAKPTVAVESQELKVQASAGMLNGMELRPTICQSAEPCPLIVVVGDRHDSPYPDYLAGANKLAAAVPAVVIVFNLPGTGAGTRKSPGVADYGGNNDVDAVKRIVTFLRTRDYIDEARTGYVTLGYGLVPVAAALEKHATLKTVAFLIDIEGAVDRCGITQTTADDAGSNSDGPGASPTACHFDSTCSHSEAFPPATATASASVVCALNSWPITTTGADCTENTWWVSREPFAKLKKLAQRYHRVQFRHDHRQPSHCQSRHAMKAVASSPSKFFVFNNIPPCEAVPDEDICAQIEAAGQSCWLQGSWGNGLAPAPYAGADLQPVSFDSLFGEVLPPLVERMIDTEKFKNCR